MCCCTIAGTILNRRIDQHERIQSAHFHFLLREIRMGYGFPVGESIADALLRSPAEIVGSGIIHSKCFFFFPLCRVWFWEQTSRVC